MPIRKRTPAECFHTFRDHLGPLLAQTLGREHHLLCKKDGNKGYLSLGASDAVGAKLRGGRGTFYFSLTQNLEAVELPDAKLWELRTIEYRYAIYTANDDVTEALLRWEYVADPPPGKRWCRHHFQIGRLDRKSVELPFNSGVLDLNRVHTPTGWVLIEDVLRFLLTDMEVEPASPEWEDVIAESREMFFEKFSRRTSLPPPV